MLSDRVLFHAGKYEFNLRHLLVIGILSIAVANSAMLRSLPADFGFVLNEYDPYFHYRATQYIVDNGIIAFHEWNDEYSWHPYGRDVSAGSQLMLYLSAASIYYVLGESISLLDVTILVPVIFGPLSALVLFALVRRIAGTTSGLIAALLMSFSIPLLTRGMIGWFKSEPVGIFYGLFAVYLFISGIKSQNRKVAIPKIIGSGILLTFSVSAWGGSSFFILLLAMFIVTLPFVRKDHTFLLKYTPLFLIACLVTAMFFQRQGIDFVLGLGGLLLGGSYIVMVLTILVHRFSNLENKLRNSLLFILFTIVSAIGLLAANVLPASFRYLSAVNPFLIQKSVLATSVAEHASVTIEFSFYVMSTMLIFAAIGIWFIFRVRSLENDDSPLRIPNDMMAFALIFGMFGVYMSSAFIRLELFASIAVISVASIGLTVLIRQICKPGVQLRKKIMPVPNVPTKMIFGALIILLLVVPLIHPVNANWLTAIHQPPSIANGSSRYFINSPDWPDTFEWMKNNTSKGSVVGSWWDYGYWIQTLGERASLADNSTSNSTRIAEIGRAFLSPPDIAWSAFSNTMDADYVLLYIAGHRVNSLNEEDGYYVLNGGGDFSKKIWFIRIGGLPESKFLQLDGSSGTDYLWQETALGSMIPFTPVTYLLQDQTQVAEYQLGSTPIYIKDVKYPADGDGPFRLAYSSPSFTDERGVLNTILIYEINKDYVPLE